MFGSCHFFLSLFRPGLACVSHLHGNILTLSLLRGVAYGSLPSIFIELWNSLQLECGGNYKFVPFSFVNKKTMQAGSKTIVTNSHDGAKAILLCVRQWSFCVVNHVASFMGGNRVNQVGEPYLGVP